MKPARMVVLADTLMELYRRMVRVRRVEERLAKSCLEGWIPGAFTSRMGAEGLAAAVCFHLAEQDLLFAPPASQAYAVARGLSLEPLFAEFYGRQSGFTEGRTGNAFLCEAAKGFFCMGNVPGSSIMEAVGAAWAFRMTDQPRVAVAVFDAEGAACGAFHEGLYLAAIQHLPVVLICEHGTTDEPQTHRFPHVAAYAKAYELIGYEVDAHDFVLIYSAAFDAIRRAREGKGPVLIDCNVQYLRSPVEESSHITDRDARPVSDRAPKDPLSQLKAVIVELDPSLADPLSRIEHEVLEEVQRAHRQALDAPWPTPKAEERYP